MKLPRRIVFRLLSLALGVAVAEGVAWIGLSTLAAAPAPADATAAAPAAEAAASPSDPAPGPGPAPSPDPAPGPGPAPELDEEANRAIGELSNQLERHRFWVVHPYVGYVAYAGVPVTVGPEVPGLIVNSFGFIDTAEPIREPAPNRVIVAITGGSVAENFGYQGYATLERLLGRDPRYAGKQFEWVRFGLSGHKQPQQLMTIAYLLTEGATFDIVLNIDGFNELALPRIDNSRTGVSASYPRRWAQRIAMLPDPRLRRISGQIEYLEARLANLLQPPSGLLRYSGIARILRRARAGRLDREVAALYLELSEALETQDDQMLIGPSRPYANRLEFARHLVGIWKHGSIGLDALAERYGFRYVHVLQPNQHVPDSKPLTPAEQELASDETMLYTDDARDFHPLLRRAGRALAESGIEFIDATEVFAPPPEPLYIDSCCHFNARGNEILAEWIADAMLRDHAREETP